MQRTYQHYWEDPYERRFLKRAAVLAILMHAVPFVAGMYWHLERPAKSIPVYDVQLVADDGVETEVSEQPAPNIPTPPPPPPEPKEEPEPEVKKEEPKPLPEPVKEAPAEKKKEEVKKPEPKKPEPKKEEPKKPPKEVEQPKLAKLDPERPPETPRGKTDAKIKKGEKDTPGINVKALPSALGAWARLVQRKVERVWVIPGGLRLTTENSAVISFWVDRGGNLVGEPIVRDDGGAPALAQSGLDAIKAAAPFPPLPDGAGGLEQEVQYNFVINQ